METTFDIVPGMKAAVVGLGRAGQSVVRYLSSQRAEIMVSDFRTFPELTEQEQALLNSCGSEYEGGGHTAEFLGRAEVIIVSPGVSLEHPALKQVIDSGLPVIGELALAAGKFKIPVIAISGTNGKTTVTELTGRLLEGAGKKVFVGGNIGTPVTEYLLDPDGYDVVVLEVSSFQLELSGVFAADVAVLLNITPDHLDRHGTLERYAKIKMNLFRDKKKTRHAIINGEDLVIGKNLHFTACDSFELFGYDTQYCSCIDASTVTVMSEGCREVYELGGSNLATVIGCLNSAAALLAVQSFKVGKQCALETLFSFKQSRHRMQDIGEIGGVTYINDSKATNTGAVSRGLEQLGGRVILIAGGKEKGDDFCLLRKAVQKYVKRLILIGDSAKKIASVLDDLVPVKYAEDMNEAVLLASLVARPGDNVLLSPACASFDMFDSYAHRGELFEKAVDDIKTGKLFEEVAP